MEVFLRFTLIYIKSVNDFNSNSTIINESYRVFACKNAYFRWWTYNIMQCGEKHVGKIGEITRRVTHRKMQLVKLGPAERG